MSFFPTSKNNEPTEIDTYNLLELELNVRESEQRLIDWCFDEILIQNESLWEEIVMQFDRLTNRYGKRS